MISSFEVGAVFKIINEASPQLTKILAQVRELQKVVDQAKVSISSIGSNPALAATIGETRDLALAWREVAKAATTANRSIAAASKRALAGPGVAGLAEARSLADTWERIAAASAAATGSTRQLSSATGGALRRATAGAAGGGAGAGGGGQGGGGRHRPGWLGGPGGAHIGGPGIPIAGGSHIRAGGVGMAALGLLGYGVEKAMQYDDAVVLMAQHSGLDLATNRANLRKMLTDAAVQTGFGEHDISLAAQQELRMFGDTGGSNGVNVLPKMLRYAATEARLKGTSLEESMSSLTGLSHMLQAYGEDDVDRLAPAFSALSVRSPMTLAQQEKAFGYAVPVLRAGMDLDPFQTMAASTALARAGITSTKAGTWIREMMKGAMPGTSLMSKMLFKKHETALEELGLVDENHKPTWFTGGKPDEMNFLAKVAENLPKIDVTRRSAILQALAGTQGAGALAVLAEPAVRQQMGAMYNETQNPENVNRVQLHVGLQRPIFTADRPDIDAAIQRPNGGPWR
jgi:hypothetical protein